MSIINNYSLVIFDYDGTLCDTRGSIKFTMNKTFTNFNKALPDQEKLEQLIGAGISLEETIQKLQTNGKLDDVSLKEWVVSYRKLYLLEGDQHTSLFDGVTALFEHIKQRDIALVVVSNKGIKAIEKSLYHFKLNHYVQLVVGGDQNMKKKPHPMIYDEIIKKQVKQSALKNVLMVGDTSADIKFAQNCAIDHCWASYGYGDQDECQSLNPMYSINSISELI